MMIGLAEVLALQRDTPVVCPVCECEAYIEYTEFGRRDTCCGLHSWGGKPLVTRETHLARRAAHAAFDPLWKDGFMGRTYAYKKLAHKLGMTSEDCHMSLMSERDALRVPDAVRRIYYNEMRRRGLYTANK